jgi:beta-phosphoglucomutase-like phosphatase (HAD superfamily)/choline kinase
MNIIIPLCGKGERFKNEGYSLPKPLISVLNKPIINYVLDSIITTENDTIYIFYNIDLDIHHFSDHIQTYSKIDNKKIVLVPILQYTKGAAETLYLGIKKCIELYNSSSSLINNPVVCYDCDTFYTVNTLKMYTENIQNCIKDENKKLSGSVFYFKTIEEKPIYSYIKLTNSNLITAIEEKNKISKLANSGIYCFSNLIQLFYYSKLVSENENYYFKNECYISSIIKKMIDDGLYLNGIELNENSIVSLGTPEKVNQFIEKYKNKNEKYSFLFDLDGTLILTDEIYFNIWKTILSKYNITLDIEMFKKYIQGNNDTYVINSLLSKVNLSLSDLSSIKDKLFIENIFSLKLINGVIDFFHSLKEYNFNIGIVTNCNREVAEYILNYLNIENLIDVLIIGNECEKSKPYPDPYLKAIKVLNTSSKMCFIFEDSKTGLLSARSVSPNALIAVKNSEYNSLSENEYKSLGVNKIITDFTSITVQSLLYEFESTNCNFYSLNINLEQVIYNNLRFIEPFKTETIKSIFIHTTKLKGGYITDALSITITTEFKKYDCVLKLENKNPSFLSKMAIELGLYEREYYFYSDILNFVKNDICVPQFYSLIKNDENGEILGILLENLYSKNCIPNLNLNDYSIDTTLYIVSKCAKLHSIFSNKSSFCETVFPQLKKHNDPLFQPKWKNFLVEKWSVFKDKWYSLLTEELIDICEHAIQNFTYIQNHLSSGMLTLCHGDVKSPNIFYQKLFNDNQFGIFFEPYFIDWQYISYGKGIQDIIFFMIESFDSSFITKYAFLIKEYYYAKFLEYCNKDKEEKNKINYSKEEYNKDFIYSIFYFPFFVTVWFGTLPQEDLIDKNFPFFFIQKFIHFIHLFNYEIKLLTINN